ncbi:MAG: hypothetical protein L0I24_00100 [Pseudonocardia sp.]|nr:hypothetical protein [Pseudonocardia sp.]
MTGWEHLFSVADVVVPLLESGATEDQLVDALGSEQARPVVRHLTSGLRAHGMLMATDSFSVAEPPPDVRVRFASSVAYLESTSDDPYAAFATIRAAGVALLGPQAVVGPAARGLTRAGVGTVIVLDPATDAHDGIHAVLWCVPDGADVWASRPAWIPQHVPIVPVVLHDQVLSAGPVVRDTSGDRVLAEFRRRVLGWAAADGLEPAARPTADALVAALAGQMLFDVLAGVAVDGTAHVVHGPDLAAERLVIGGTEVQGHRRHRLGEVTSTPLPTSTSAVTMAESVATRWTGLFTRADGEDLPQLPLSLREVEYRAGRTGSVVAWAAEQESAIVCVALEALRQWDPGTRGAAGLTEERWLLDGALRLLIDEAHPTDVVTIGDVEPETLRIWREFTSWTTRQHRVRLLRCTGIDWSLGRVESLAGACLGQAWACDPDTAVRDALAAALTSVQVNRIRPGRPCVAEVCTDSLVNANGSTVAVLRSQIVAHGAAAGISYDGTTSRTDPVLGAIPFWFGPVGVRPIGVVASHAL